MTLGKAGKLALLWRGNRQERGEAPAQNNRLNPVFEALTALGIDAEPAIYGDGAVDDVRKQLLKLDGVLVWVDPISDGENRTQLDAMLRDIASKGVWVSAHPDVILKMGVKEVLYRTKHLDWGTDTHLYRTARAFNEQFPGRLQSAGPRVLKQNRGNGGQGVWKAELVSADRHQATFIRVLHARRGSVPEEMPLGDFMRCCEAYFADEGCMVDQPFQPRLGDGMIRCYMGADKVVGFGHQLIKALIPPPPEGPELEAAQPGPRIMHPASAPAFQALRKKMESEWVPQMMQLLPFRARTPYSTYILVEAGTQRYNVGTDTPKLWATSLGDVPEESNFLAALTSPSVIRRFRPPTRPCRFAASNPARVRSIISSRSICADGAHLPKRNF
jgi:hypothetical protein